MLYSYIQNFINKLTALVTDTDALETTKTLAAINGEGAIIAVRPLRAPPATKLSLLTN